MAQIRASKDVLIYENPDTEVKVFKGRFGEDNIPVAIKEQIHDDLQDANYALREAINQIQLDHEAIIKVYDCQLESVPPSRIRSILITELMDHDLHSEVLLRAQNDHYWSEPELLHMLRLLTDGLVFAQSRGISHRDIKPQNVFVTGERVKIGDFGSSKGNLGRDPSSFTLQGSPFFLSPELKMQYLSMLEGQDRRAAYDPFRSDVYSLGVTFLYMARLKNPLELANMARLRQETAKLTQDCGRYPILQSILVDMLELEPSRRVDFLGILQRLEMNRVQPLEPPQCEERRLIEVADYNVGAEMEVVRLDPVDHSNDLTLCSACGRFQLPGDISDIPGDSESLEDFCTCSRGRHVKPIAPPCCPDCQLPLIHPQAGHCCHCTSKCVICSQPVTNQDWISKIPRSLDRFTEMFPVLCTPKCLLKLGHSSGVRSCVSCWKNVKREDLDRKRAVEMECGHHFHNLICFYNFLKTSMTQADSSCLCPLCDDLITYPLISQYLGRSNLLNLKRISNHETCIHCHQGVALIPLTCNHSVCVECLQEEKQCPMCSYQCLMF